jgi:hypothetical protein
MYSCLGADLQLPLKRRLLVPGGLLISAIKIGRSCKPSRSFKLGLERFELFRFLPPTLHVHRSGLLQFRPLPPIHSTHTHGIPTQPLNIVFRARRDAVSGEKRVVAEQGGVLSARPQQIMGRHGEGTYHRYVPQISSFVLGGTIFWREQEFAEEEDAYLGGDGANRLPTLSGASVRYSSLLLAHSLLSHHLRPCSRVSCLSMSCPFSVFALSWTLHDQCDAPTPFLAWCGVLIVNVH